MTEVENIQSQGYHGGFLSDIPELQLQKCSENNVDINFSLFNKSSLKSDKAVVNLEVEQSFGPGNYNLDNMYGCDCSLTKAREVQLSQPNINFNGGSGWMGEGGCLIDKYSDLRVNKEKLTNRNFIHQYPNLLNQGFFGKGQYDVDTETLIRDSDLTTEQRPCNVLSGSTTLPYSFTPMLQKLDNEVQDPKNIIPEDSMDSWISGGLPTRQIVRNIDHMKRVQAKK